MYSYHVQTIAFSEWKLTDDAAHEGRCEFVGKEDVQSEYLGKSVAETYGRSQNPVKYINM